MKKQVASDFRYDTGLTKIPWPAVGETISAADILEIVKFLVPPGEKEKAKKYITSLARINKDLSELLAAGQSAGKLSLSSNVQRAEEEVCKILNVKHSVFLTNATAGFEIAYKFAGLKPGDEVIAPAITFIATIAYPLSIGAKVVLADVDARTLNIDPKDVARKITPKTKAIIPVHIGGFPVDMDPIMALAKKHNITVIEDAAHGFGGSYKGKMLGTIAHFGAFSFHEVKNITSLGEGGILCTNDDTYGQDLRKARFLGVDASNKLPNWFYDVKAFSSKDGFFASGNYSTTEIQAVGLLQQFKRLKKIITARRAASEYLKRRFQKIEGIITQPLDDAKIKSTHHLFLLQIDPKIVGGDIQTLKSKLDAKGITQIQHYAPLYKFSIMRKLGYDTKAIQDTCPVSEEAYEHRFTHLPLYKFTRDQLKLLADTVIGAVQEMKQGK